MADNTRTDTILLRLLHNQGLVVYENIGAAEKVFDPKIPIGIVDSLFFRIFQSHVQGFSTQGRK